MLIIVEYETRQELKVIKLIFGNKVFSIAETGIPIVIRTGFKQPKNSELTEQNDLFITNNDVAMNNCF